MNNLHWIEKVTDYGAKQVLLKRGRRILAWVESYPKNTAVDSERGKWFYAFGKPSDKSFTSFTVNNIDEGKKKVIETLILQGEIK